MRTLHYCLSSSTIPNAMAYNMSYDSLSTNAPYNNGHGLQESGGVGKFPHTRAQLSAFARQYKPNESYESEELDDYHKVPTSLVNEVVSLLTDERDDELQDLLKRMYSMNEQSVCISALPLPWLCRAQCLC